MNTSRISTIFDESCIEALRNSDFYQDSYDYRSQCYATYTILGWSKNIVAKLFSVDHKALEKQLSLPLTSNNIGRPISLNSSEIIDLENEVRKQISDHNCPTLYDLEQYIISKFKKLVTPDTIRNYILKSGEFKIIDGEQQDEDITQVNPQDIENYCDNLEKTVNTCPASLVFNMDEAGQDEYIDTHSMRVIVLSTYNGFNIKIPVRRKNKCSTLVHCINLNGTYLKPLVIIPRKTVDNIILKRATYNNFLLKFQNKGFSTTELTKIWLTEIFFPEVERRWNEEHQRTVYNGNAVQIIDGCSTHGAAFRLFNLVEKHIDIIYLVPHSSHLTQPLDFALFAIQKLNSYKKKLTLRLSDQADKIRRYVQL